MDYHKIKFHPYSGEIKENKNICGHNKISADNTPHRPSHTNFFSHHSDNYHFPAHPDRPSPWPNDLHRH